MRFLSCLMLFFLSALSSALCQNYTSYFTGNTNDTTTIPSGGICLMGGASEEENAMIWFLEQANGGDVLVLRASGSNGYNNYLYSDLGVSVNSVETIVFNNSTAANEIYIHQRIQQAEAIWFAGGNQWNYISYWRNNQIENLINNAISNRNIVVGGTSAGMAILGGYYFSAANGTVTSATALSNPFDGDITVDSVSFIENAYLSNVITDTHYDNPDRKGRHLVFLARILVDYGIKAKGIACDEYTAICIDTNGIAKVFGDAPTYDDNAYFIQTNCELTSVVPENCSLGNPLDWNLGNEAIQVYSVKGTTTGSNTFDLNDWNTGTGGIWENWYVDNGVLYETPSVPPMCSMLITPERDKKNVYKIYPNPSEEIVIIEFNDIEMIPESIRISNLQGEIKKEVSITIPEKTVVKVSDLPPGIYFIQLSLKNNKEFVEKLIIK